ncbi:MAG TPA: quinone-dependent dihydroorotate dehydrogenase [Alphaproteobacteria bacterium]|nr:quinone-dependent dihydroorotate dehydrogenase [Alphaproteobacteria bacterium]
MIDLYCLAGPVLRSLGPETAHGLAIKALKTGMAPACPVVPDDILKTRAFGMEFPNPVGLAAGFDKDAEVADALLAQGFGFVEVGSITPEPQPGNPRPRLFRLSEDGAIINRMGFNSRGQRSVAMRLETRLKAAARPPGIVGVNLGLNKDCPDPAMDYVRGVRTLGPFAGYLVINVSSPNTPGLRALQSRDRLAEILSLAIDARDGLVGRRPPLLLKIAPDLTEEDKKDIADISLALGIDGLIATNTTIDRPDGLAAAAKGELGGLSGKPLLALSTRVLADMYKLTQGRLALIGVGGVASGEDAYAKIRAGASLVQLYTALIYHGPGLCRRICRDLAARLRADGFKRLGEAVGADHR